MDYADAQLPAPAPFLRVAAALPRAAFFAASFATFRHAAMRRCRRRGSAAYVRDMSRLPLVKPARCCCCRHARPPARRLLPPC